MEQGKKQCFQAQDTTSTSSKGMSADWRTETVQLELFPKLTSVRHCKDIFSESGIKYFAFSAQNFFSHNKETAEYCCVLLGAKTFALSQ